MKYIGLVIVLLALGLYAFVRVQRWNEQRTRVARMSPVERSAYEESLEVGVLNPHVHCRFCKTQGSVRTKPIVRERFTVTTTNTFIKKRTTSVTHLPGIQMTCEICAMRWDVR